MFFDAFTDILFLPLAIVLLVSIPAFGLFRKSAVARSYGIGLLVLLLIMVLWRIPLAYVSARYWSIILFPAILFVVFYCYSCGAGKWIPRLLMAVLVVICLGKDFRLNWNNRAITNAADAIAADAQAYQRVLISELRMTDLLDRIGYYTRRPVLSSVYCEGLRIQDLYEPARGLYDVLYLVTQNTVRENENIRQQLQPYGATLLFSQDKDMHKKKKVYVYKIEPLPQKNPDLPITWPMCFNGDFETLVTDKNGFTFPQNWGKVGNTTLVEKGRLSGNHEIAFGGENLCLLYGPRHPVLQKDGVLLFSVNMSAGSHIRIYCFGFDENNHKTFEKILMLAIAPEEAKYQFQIPLHAADFAPAVMVSYYWYIISPNGMTMDNVGFCDFDQ